MGKGSVQLSQWSIGEGSRSERMPRTDTLSAPIRPIRWRLCPRRLEDKWGTCVGRRAASVHPVRSYRPRCEANDCTETRSACREASSRSGPEFRAARGKANGAGSRRAVLPRTVVRAGGEGQKGSDFVNLQHALTQCSCRSASFVGHVGEGGRRRHSRVTGAAAGWGRRAVAWSKAARSAGSEKRTTKRRKTCQRSEAPPSGRTTDAQLCAIRAAHARQVGRHVRGNVRRWDGTRDRACGPREVVKWAASPLPDVVETISFGFWVALATRGQVSHWLASRPAGAGAQANSDKADRARRLKQGSSFKRCACLPPLDARHNNSPHSPHLNHPPGGAARRCPTRLHAWPAEGGHICRGHFLALAQCCHDSVPAPDVQCHSPTRPAHTWPWSPLVTSQLARVRRRSSHMGHALGSVPVRRRPRCCHMGVDYRSCSARPQVGNAERRRAIRRRNTARLFDAAAQQRRRWQRWRDRVGVQSRGELPGRRCAMERISGRE